MANAICGSPVRENRTPGFMCGELVGSGLTEQLLEQHQGTLGCSLGVARTIGERREGMLAATDEEGVLVRCSALLRPRRAVALDAVGGMALKETRTVQQDFASHHKGVHPAA